MLSTIFLVPRNAIICGSPRAPPHAGRARRRQMAEPPRCQSPSWCTGALEIEGGDEGDALVDHVVKRRVVLGGLDEARVTSLT
jgi:hypothetical protein